MTDLKTINEFTQKYEKELLSSIAQIIATDSSQQEAKEGMPFGEGPAKALDDALKIAQKLGFKTKNLDNYIGYAEMGEGEELIGILGHLDVVPAGSGWSTDPFKLTENDGVLYARGITDDKGPIITALYAAKIVMDMGIPLKKRVRIVFGTNEETGFGCVKYYAKKEGGFTCGFTPDASFPLIFGEKGNYGAVISAPINSPGAKIQVLSISGGDAKNIVCDKCTAVLKANEETEKAQATFEQYAKENKLKTDVSCKDGNLTLTLFGAPAHASLPEQGINAASHMMAFLEKLLPESTFVKGYNRVIGLTYDGSLAGIAHTDEYGPLTFNVGIIKADEQTASATIDIRVPILTEDFTPYSEKLAKAFADNRIHFEGSQSEKPLLADPNSKLVQKLAEAYSEVTGDTENKPFAIGGGTYAKAFKNIVAFGPEYPGYEHCIHTANERMPLEYIRTAFKVYTKAIISLLEM